LAFEKHDDRGFQIGGHDASPGVFLPVAEPFEASKLHAFGESDGLNGDEHARDVSAY
jgi:hypothetical protein